MLEAIYFVRKRAQLVAHIQNTTSQYNLEPLGKLARPHHRRDRDIAGHFPDPVVQLMIQANLDTIDHFDPLIKELDKQILALAKQHDPTSFHLRGNKQAEKYYNRLISKHGKGKALSIIAKRLGTAVYYMLKRREPVNEHTFLHMTAHKPMA